MDKNIVWTDTAKKDLTTIFIYLNTNWPSKVLSAFSTLPDYKIKLISAHPNIGFKSKKYSRLERL